MPLFVVAGLIPWFVRLHPVPLGPEFGFIRNFWAIEWDLFVYWKSRILLICGGFSLLAILCHLPSFLKTHLGKAVAVIGLGALLSSGLSPYWRISMWGLPNYQEGTWVFLTYLLLSLSAFLHLREIKYQKVFFSCLFVSVLMVAVLSFFQVNGFQYLFQFPLSLWIFGDASTAQHFRVNTNIAFSTLMNSNHLGLFASVTAPVFLVFALFPPFLKRAVWLVALAASTACGYWSGSRGSFFSMSVAFVGIGFMLLIRHRWRWAGFGCVLVAGIMSVVLYRHWPNDRKPNPHVRHFSVEKGVLRFLTTEFGLLITSDAQGLHFSDLLQKPLHVRYEPGRVKIEEGEFERADIFLMEHPPLGRTIQIQYRDTRISVVPTPEGVKLADWNTPMDTRQPAVLDFGFSPYFASGRGYIWWRTLPLLADNWILGRGLALLVLDFPQRDMFGKIQMGWDSNIIVDRPHNLYLQIWHGCGFVSLVAFLILGGLALWKNVSNQNPNVVALGSLAGSIGYLVNGLTTDSMVGVSGIFWILLGISLSTKLPVSTVSARLNII